jgi:hypothetical protein
MSRWAEEDPWVWVVVQDPERNEQFLGQHDRERDVSFIPFFREKEEARAALYGLARDESLEYEVQAIRYRNLAEHAARNGFRLFLLDGRGVVLEQLEP